jgi:hypothetical protein
VQERFLSFAPNTGYFSHPAAEKGHDIAAACGQLRLHEEPIFMTNPSFSDFRAQFIPENRCAETTVRKGFWDG